MINLIIPYIDKSEICVIFLLNNYKKYKNIKNIYILNYTNNYNNIFNKNIKINYINIEEFKFDYNLMFNSIKEENNFYIHTYLFSIIPEYNIDILVNNITENKLDIIYFYGLKLCIDDKHVNLNKIYSGLNRSTFIFGSSALFKKNNYIAIDNKNLKCNYYFDIDKYKPLYYDITNCFQETALIECFLEVYFNILKYQYIDFDLFYEKFTCNKYDYGKIYYFNTLINNVNNIDENYYLKIYNLPYVYNKLLKYYEFNYNLNENLVSIIITVYNKEKYLKNSIDSILNQTYKNIEIIIIEDCSLDNSKLILKQYENINNIKIIYNQTNKGCYCSRNVGLSNSLGDYIFFHDSDDYCVSNRIELQLNYMKNNNYLFSGCNMIRTHIPDINYDNDNDIMNNMVNLYCNNREDCCIPFFGFPTLMFKRELINDCGYYIEKYKGMDMEYAERILYLKLNIIFDNDSWDYFDKCSNKIYGKLNKLLVISPQMDNNNLTNNITSDDYLKKKLWRKTYISSS